MKVIIPPFETVKVIVVGDIMLDRYWRGGTKRISPEAPVPVVSVQEIEERPGGAGNVAINLSTLGVQVTLFSLVGNDAAGQTLENKLTEAGVECHLKCIAGMPTITKLRIIDEHKHQQLLRLDFEQRFDNAANTFLDDYRLALKDAGAVILSDYGKGSLAAVRELIHAAKEAKVPVLVDPKSNDFTIYRGATIITPNLKEFEAVVGPCQNEEDIVTKGLNLIRQQDLSALLVTRGEQGLTLIQEDQNPLHLPTRAREVYDVTGAGDTVISVLAATMAAGDSLSMAAVLANTAAGIAVQKMGTATVSISELRRALQRLHASEVGVLSEEELLVSVADARAHGETIVMTNGCFDILHPGHIVYLEQAKELGKRLIVAINDDASVARLKGSDRPVNSLEHRMKMLAALRAVDWVVAFSEDTPARLISRVSPDVLVKGGDYKPEEIAGADHVIKTGGEVKILTFVPGYSTSSIIEKIQDNVTTDV